MATKSETQNPKESLLTTAEYSDRIKNITTKPLSVETIDTYASSALEELIGLTVDVVEQYEDISPTVTTTKLETEDAAFEYFGLDNISDLLEHIARIASDIDSLDDVIGSITVQTPRVILPPESRSMPPRNTGESYVAPGVTPRLKTLLFLLQQHFGIDINPATTGISIRSGTLDKNSMRKISYSRVIVPQLHREVLICDEERNITFILHSDKFVDVPIESLCDMGKSEISQLLRDNPSLGKKIRYSDKYVQNIIQSLSEDESDEPTTFLSPRVAPPEGVVSRPAIMKELGLVDWRVTQRLIDEASADPGFGTIGVYRFGSAGAKGYTPEQQALIKSVLESQPEKAPLPPDGVISVVALARTLRISDGTCRNYVYHLQETDPEFGEVKIYLYRATTGIGLDSRQQEKVRAYAEKKLPQAPGESITSASVVAEQVGVTFNTLARYLQRIMETRTDFGEIGYFAFGNNKAGQGLTDGQRDIVLQEMLEVTSTPRATEGIFTSYAAAEILGSSHTTVANIASELSANDPKFGAIGRYLFVRKRGRGYTREQVDLIAAELKRRRAKLGQTALKTP